MVKDAASAGFDTSATGKKYSPRKGKPPAFLAFFPK